MDANTDTPEDHPSRRSDPRPAARSRRSKDIRADDRFAKVTDLLEAAQTVWVVSHAVEPPGLPRHVKLFQEDMPNRAVTVALSALMDRRLYRRLDPQARPVAGKDPAANLTLAPIASTDLEASLDDAATANPTDPDTTPR